MCLPGGKRHGIWQEAGSLAAAVGNWPVKIGSLSVIPNENPAMPHCPRQPPRGATEIVAFPYFLAAGTHVAQDIPEAIAEFSAEHPAVKVRLTPD